MNKSNTFEKLMSVVTEVGTMYEDLIYIGGIAVYLHAINQESTKAYAEATNDADLYISIASLSDLRDIEELTQNHRLSKLEFQKGGFSFDVYAERRSKLPVPYDQVAAYAIEYAGIRVACLEHLIVLKLEAAVDRHASEHGRKDAKDVIRILLLSNLCEFDPQRAVAYMRDDHFGRLEAIMGGPEFVSLAQGNAKIAKELKLECAKAFLKIKAAYESPDGTGGAGDGPAKKANKP